MQVSDGFSQCAASVPLKVQRLKSGNWKTVKSTTTGNSGSYKVNIPDKEGKYRAKAPKVVSGGGVGCLQGHDVWNEEAQSLGKSSHRRDRRA